ncbi:MAG: hypothetical protein ABI771_11610 [Betaproteobacteria bacterium]
MNALRLEFCWPPHSPSTPSDNFFLGVWHPERNVEVSWAGEQPTVVRTRSGSNGALASAVSSRHHDDGALIHESADGRVILGFRGYLTHPPLHSYSPAEHLTAYWRDDWRREHNGVFSAARICTDSGELLLATDLLGFSPLYYTQWAGAIVFSTNPRLLVIPHAKPDQIAWLGLLESGFISSDRTLNQGVCRLPAGKVLRATRDGVIFDTWLSLDSMPPGDRPLDSRGIAEVEDIFHQAVDRCLALESLNVVLPLSSGHDSRRILGSLLRKRATFESITCRVFHKGRDLDARFASEMARDLGLSHRIVEPPSAEQFALDDRTRQILTDAESGMHSWVPQFMRALPDAPTMVLDGVVGDILGNPGFRIPGLYQSREQDTQIILDASLKGAFNNVLDWAHWPASAAVREDLREYLQQMPQRVNLAEFAFILLRQRRTTSPWSQALLPPGHVAVCPFLDLDYLRLLLSFVPADKHVVILQRRCLAEFWPDLYRYAGTRDIPENVDQNSWHFEHERVVACRKLRFQELKQGVGLPFLRRLLAPRGRMALLASRLSRKMILGTEWQLATLEEFVLREIKHTHGWRIRE